MNAIERMTARINWVNNQCAGQRRPLAAACVLMLSLYCLSLIVAPGWLTFFASACALVPITITCLVRANDIKPTQTGLVWNTLRLGFVLAAFGAIGILVGPFLSDAHHALNFPTWHDVLFRIGLALIMTTLPKLPQ